MEIDQTGRSLLGRDIIRQQGIQMGRLLSGRDVDFTTVRVNSEGRIEEMRQFSKNKTVIRKGKH